MQALRIAVALWVLLPGCVPFFDTTPSGEITEGSTTDASEEVGPDVVAPDLAAPDLPDVEYNSCGGTETLRFEGNTAVVGGQCGDCGAGFLICNGPDGLLCSGATPLNACGRCGELPAEPGAPCGPCEPGVWTCEGDRLECVGATPQNTCGGCAELDGEPGFLCDGGTFQCSDRNSVVCDPQALNACGHRGPLVDEDGEEALAGDSCGPCEDGVLQCSPRDDGTLVCVGAREPNGCGGCAILAGEPSTQCGPCDGSWTCESTERVSCSAQAPNRCGGCSGVSSAASCEVGGGVCVGPNETGCISLSRENNVCGGFRALNVELGSACGTCDSGVVACAGVDETVCLGDLELAALNACGGCGELPAPLGSPCEECGRWSCDDNQNPICDRRACEG